MKLDDYRWKNDYNQDAAVELLFIVDKVILHNTRAIYNGLDWLGDVGGLYDGLKLVVFAFMSFANGINYTGSLLSKLFFEQDSTAE